MQSEPASNHPDDSDPDEWGICSVAMAYKVEEALGEECLSVGAIATGAHHIIYRLVMSRRQVVARVLFPLLRKYGAGVTPKDKIESEIATMRYVKMHTSIPVPTVLHHDRDLAGEVGGEWMVMEEIPGKNLLSLWGDLSSAQRRQAALAMVNIWTKLMDLRFDSIGSIRSPENMPDEFYVGPMTFMPSNRSGIAGPPIPSGCGPFSSTKEWMLAMARQQMDFISEKPRSPEETAWMTRVIEDVQTASIHDLVSQPTTHLDPLLSINVLHHLDLERNNIMVDPDDPSVITGVIDWEGAQVVPLWSLIPKFFRKTDVVPNPELEELEMLMWTKFMDTVPEWKGLTKATCALRTLCTRAKLSDFDPKVTEQSLKYADEKFRKYVLD